MSEGRLHADSPEGPAGRPNCPNCGDVRSGRFCAACGQNDRSYVRGLGAVAWDLCRDSFEVDSRLIRTLKLLLFRPGSLTIEFSANRRAGYMSPVRLYLFAGFLFVLVLSLAMPGSFSEPDPVSAGSGDGDGSVEGSPHRSLTAAETAALKAAVGQGKALKVDDVLGRPGGNVARTALVVLAGGLLPESPAVRVPAFAAPVEDLGPPFAEDESRDDPDDAGIGGDPGRGGSVAVAPAAEDPERPNPLVRMFLSSLVDLVHDPEVFVQRAVGNLPIAMFFLLPFLALALALCYFRKRRFFVEHLVFGMHNQTLAFLCLAAALLAPEGPVGRWFRLFFIVAPQAYYLVALRRYYGDGWFRTLIKGFAVWGLYMAVLLPGLFAVLFLTA